MFFCWPSTLFWEDFKSMETQPIILLVIFLPTYSVGKIFFFLITLPFSSLINFWKLRSLPHYTIAYAQALVQVSKVDRYDIQNTSLERYSYPIFCVIYLSFPSPFADVSYFCLSPLQLLKYQIDWCVIKAFSNLCVHRTYRIFGSFITELVFPKHSV